MDSIPTPSSKPGDSKLSPTCHGLSSNKYASPDTLLDIIKNKFCPEADRQGQLDKNSGSISRTYFSGTMAEVEIAMDWEPGINFKPYSMDCIEHLYHTILEGCETYTQENPMDWKGGGSVTVGPVRYRIDPLAKRRPYPQAPRGLFIPMWNQESYLYRIWGNGWLDSDYGKALENQLRSDCKLGEFRDFKYKLGDQDTEWEVFARMEDRNIECVESAGRKASRSTIFQIACLDERCPNNTYVEYGYGLR